MVLERLCAMITLKTMSYVELSVCMVVVGCGCSNYLGEFLRIIHSFVLMNSADTLALDADDMAWWMMIVFACTAPLLIIGCPHFYLFVKKNPPLDLLRAFGLER